VSGRLLPLLETERGNKADLIRWNWARNGVANCEKRIPADAIPVFVSAIGVFRGETNVSEEIKIGDVVRLASGGRRMTVTGIGSNPDTLVCVWYGDKIDSGVTESGEFPAADLVLAPSPPPKAS
jgi:uncharacterized protein YodC (DUF2158 family)